MSPAVEQALFELQNVHRNLTSEQELLIKRAGTCQELGISASETARHLGVDRSTVSRWYAKARGADQ